MAGSGSAQLRELAVRLKAAGDGALRVELLRGLRTAAQPLVTEVQAAAMEKLPKRGGLNVQVASQKVTVSVRTGARTAGVRLVTRAPDTAWTDAGYVRHPVFKSGKWVTQQIPNAAGWWSQTLNSKAGPEVGREMAVVMAEVAAKIRGAGL